HVHRHIVVQDLDREVFTLLAEHLPLFLLDHGSCPMVGVHDLVADFVQATSLSPVFAKTPANLVLRRRNAFSIAEMPGKRHFSRTFRENPWKAAPYSWR